MECISVLLRTRWQDAHKHTYRGDDTSLEIATLEARQKQSSGITRSDSSCAGEESDGVETHGDLLE
jgi:hypothetical protein